MAMFCVNFAGKFCRFKIVLIKYRSIPKAHKNFICLPYHISHPVRCACVNGIYPFHKESTSFGWPMNLQLNNNNAMLSHSISRYFSSSTVLNENELRKCIENLTTKFTEARELLEDAKDSHGSVYFQDDLSEAQEVVKETLEEYSTLLSKLTDQQKTETMRTIGLRMEELKAQQSSIEDLGE